MILLDANEGDDTRIGVAGSIMSAEPQRVVVILTNAGSVSERLIDAVQREFPEFVSNRLRRSMRPAKPFPIQRCSLLILPSVREAEAAAASLLRAHPHALAAVIEPYDKVLKTILELTLPDPR